MWLLLCVRFFKRLRQSWEYINIYRHLLQYIFPKRLLKTVKCIQQSFFVEIILKIEKFYISLYRKKLVPLLSGLGGGLQNRIHWFDSNRGLKWNLSIEGPCVRLKILRTWFDSTRFHKHFFQGNNNVFNKTSNSVRNYR